MKRRFWLAVARGVGNLIISGAAVVAAYQAFKAKLFNPTRRS